MLLLQLEDYFILLTKAAFIKKRPSPPCLSSLFLSSWFWQSWSCSFRKACSHYSWLESFCQSSVPAFQLAVVVSLFLNQCCQQVYIIETQCYFSFSIFSNTRFYRSSWRSDVLGASSPLCELWGLSYTDQIGLVWLTPYRLNEKISYLLMY